MLPQKHVRNQFHEVPSCQNAACKVIASQGSEAASQLPKFLDTFLDVACERDFYFGGEI